MPLISSETLHATAVAIDGRAVVLEGLSGAGKSDLALRLIDRGATLISDDYTLLVRSGEALLARNPGAMAGKIEVRGLGIVDMPHVADIPVGLVVRLGGETMRMPERRVRRIAGVVVREVAIDAFHASAAIKVELALRQPVEEPS
ncbi:MAG: aldolase [Sphingomonas sp.]|nr:MAG: aldolase [Sphingomonas sp.]